MIIRPENYGAKADGVTNDAAALWQALDAASEGDTVLLQPNKKYYIAPCLQSEEASFTSSSALSGGKGIRRAAAIDLDGVNNLTIRGENTTVLLERPLFYCNINNTRNVTLEGLIFDYRVRPFVKADLVELSENENTAVFKTDRQLGIAGETDIRYSFGVLDRPDGRYHMFMQTVTPIDEQANLYKILFSEDEQTHSRLQMLKTNVLIAPVPGFAHRIERAFSIVGNRDFTMRSCKVYSMARFGFALFRNEGTVRFENLRVEKAPDETVNIVGWRDCFHVKENHAKFIWDHCYAEYCYDDIFNISASTLNVGEVLSDTLLDFEWRETHGVYPAVRPGDTVEFFDFETGEDLGSSEICEIVRQEQSHNVYRFKTPIAGIRAGENIKAHVVSLGSPGSEITHCDFRGTFRFRSPIEITHTHFYAARFWIDLCMPVEGPVPKHIHFTDCDFVCDDEENPYFHIVAQKKTAAAQRQYHLEDIVFKNCRLPLKTLEIAESDRPYVTIR